MPAQLVETAFGVTLSGRRTTYTSPDIENKESRGVVVTLVTTVIGTGNITLSIRGIDKISRATYLLLSGAAVSTNTTNRYTVYPGMAAVANVSASDVIPELFQIVVTANNANPATYTVGACLIPGH